MHVSHKPEAFDVRFVELTAHAADADERLGAPDDGGLVLVQVAQNGESGGGDSACERCSLVGDNTRATFSSVSSLLDKQ